MGNEIVDEIVKIESEKLDAESQPTPISCLYVQVRTTGQLSM